MDGFSLALNWYLNTNLTVNFDWIYNYRYNLPAAGSPIYSGAGAVAARAPGSTNGFGTRVQLSW